MKDTIFTPRHQLTGERLEIELTPRSAERVAGQLRNLPWTTVAIDTSGKLWLIEGAECNLEGCGCDAVAREIKSADEVPWAELELAS